MPRPVLLLVANTGEEGEGNLAGHAPPLPANRHWRGQIHGFLVVDGANTDHITNRALGSRRFEVSFTGPGGHSWSDFGVGNPVHALCRAVALFAETRIDGAPKSSVNVGLIEGGSGVNAIAQSARAKVDIRSESNQRMDDLVDALSAAVDRARESENQRATAGRVVARVREIGSRPGGRARRTMRRILHYVRAVDAHLGVRSHLDTRLPTPTSRSPGDSGCRASAPAASGGGAHTTQEWFSPDGRDLGLKRIFLTLLLLLRGAGGGDREVSRGRAEAALAVNTLVWGGTFVLVKAALVHISPVFFLAARFTLAAVALLIVFRECCERSLHRRRMAGGGA